MKCIEIFIRVLNMNSLVFVELMIVVINLTKIVILILLEKMLLNIRYKICSYINLCNYLSNVLFILLEIVF